jgi:hypothetical protein
MGHKDRLKRMQQSLRGEVESFPLKDGSRYYFDPKSGEVFLHWAACTRAHHAEESWPDPPPMIKALARARNREAAVKKVATASFPYEVDALVERGELLPRDLTAGLRSHEDGF